MAGRLHDFVGLPKREGAAHITTELALRWAKQPATTQPAYWACAIGHRAALRRLAQGDRPRTEVPPDGLLPHRYRRKPPHIYSDDEIEPARRRPPRSSHRSKGCGPPPTPLSSALLAATGMRVSEALKLGPPRCRSGDRGF